MNKKLYLLPLLLLALVFTSCEETKEAGRYDNWKVRGELYIDSIANVYNEQTDQTLPADRIYRLVDQYNQEYVYYKKYADYEANSNQQVLYTDSVNLYYRVKYFNGDKVVENFVKEDPDIDFDLPRGLRVNSNIAGLTWALQDMKQGERWILYVPSQCAYGSGTGDADFVGKIEPYSTFEYDITLVKIVDD